MGVKLSNQLPNQDIKWLIDNGDSMEMAYPSGQEWGAVFITVGVPVDTSRPWKDFSHFSQLSVDLKGESGGESVAIGIKDADDEDTGQETKISINNLTNEWKTYEFRLQDFTTAHLNKLYVVTEFVFSGNTAETVYFRNVRYLP
jgi:hypothetical protein